MLYFKKILYTSFFLFITLTSWSCTCIGKNNIRKELKRVDLVFKGKVLSKRTFIVPDTNIVGLDLIMVEFSFLVNDFYKKNTNQDTIKIITNISNDVCGFEFSVGDTYIVYSQYENKYFGKGQKVAIFNYTDICSRTCLFNKKEARQIKRAMRCK